MYYYRTRYLDPKSGRFTTRDTIGLWGDPANLGNGYTYVGNNPWTYIDPYGLFWREAGDFATGAYYGAGELVYGAAAGAAGVATSVYDAPYALWTQGPSAAVRAGFVSSV